jgi:phosphatidylcholine synthase
VIPALLIYRFGLVPAGWEIPAAAWIMLTSLYCLGNRDMKTGDLYFSGFPAVWNVVVLYFYVLETGPWANLAAIWSSASSPSCPSNMSIPSGSACGGPSRSP